MPGTYRQTGKGPYRTVAPIWPASTIIRPGDLIVRESGVDKPAAEFTWTTNIATTAAAAHDVFRGVATAGRRSDQTTAGDRADGMIVATGEFEYPCTALGSAAASGALVSFEANGGGTAMESQKVRITTVVAEAIGVLTEDAAIGATSLKFEIHPALFDRGVQAIL